jgi:hypothetical protein
VSLQVRIRQKPIDYRARLLVHLIDYKRSVLNIREPGVFRYRGCDVPKEHILPIHRKWENLLEPARSLAQAYVASHRQTKLHRYFHHLNSSQALAFNLFFPYFGGETSGSAALLRALGQGSSLGAWTPEAVPDPIEGTNLDAQWRLADGTMVMCEVKLSEADFGKAEQDAEHVAKLRDIYRPVLAGHVALQFLETPAFFAHYQILRNVWHMLRVPSAVLVFLLPRANQGLWDELLPLLDALTPQSRQRVAVIAIEDVLDSLQRDEACPLKMREYARRLEEKYVFDASCRRAAASP